MSVQLCYNDKHGSTVKFRCQEQRASGLRYRPRLGSPCERMGEFDKASRTCYDEVPEIDLESQACLWDFFYHKEAESHGRHATGRAGRES